MKLILITVHHKVRHVVFLSHGISGPVLGDSSVEFEGHVETYCLYKFEGHVETYCLYKYINKHFSLVTVNLLLTGIF